MSNYDAFGDITDEDFGLLDGVAVQHLRRARTTPTTDGMLIEMPCGMCGMSIGLTISWPEVVSLKYGISPDKWISDPHGPVVAWSFGADTNQGGQAVGAPAWRPNLECRCGGHYPLRVRQDEFESWLRSARSARVLNPQVEANISAQAAQRAGYRPPQQPQPQQLPRGRR